MRSWAEVSGEAPVPSRRPRRVERQDNIRRVEIDGVTEALLPIRFVANGLGRSSACIRKWERDGLFPPALVRVSRSSQHGDRRLYPRSYVEQVIEIAFEEKIVGVKVADFSLNSFSLRAWALFNEYARKIARPLPDGRVRL